MSKYEWLLSAYCAVLIGLYWRARYVIYRLREEALSRSPQKGGGE